MRDRAVVDDSKETWSGCHVCAHCGEVQIVTCQQCGSLIPDEPAPRAVVGISPDRQWLAVLELWTRGDYFMIYRFDPQPELVESWRWVDKVWDTGQSADAVLDAFLQQRGS